MCRKFYFLIFFALVIALAVGDRSAADTLYYDNFDGPADVNLNGLAPDITIGSNVWVAGADFDANGAIVWDGNGFGDSAYLPFSPADGYIYTLSATIDVYSGPNVPDNNWVAVGFTPSNAVPDARFFNDAGNRNPIYWALSRTASADQNDQTFTGPNATGGEDSDTISENNIDIVLDTTLSPWVVQWYYNSVLKRTVDVAEAQKSNFDYVAISTNRCDALISEFELTRQLGSYAADPDPVNGQVGVPRDVVFGWTPGVGADKHDVYVGTDFDDVNNATRASHSGVLYYNEAQDANSYDPAGLLDYFTTYYWRIDEVDGGSPTKGQVWNFSTELEAGVVTLYYDNFDGASGTDLDGTTPDITTGGNVWDAGLSVDADGYYSALGSSGTMFTAVLPFTPIIGAVYELSASIDNTGDWMGIGFINTATPNVGNRILDNSPVLWSLVRGSGAGTGDQAFIGPGTGGALGDSSTSSAEIMKVRIEMNSATEWMVSWYFDGSLEFQQTINPGTYGIDIQYVAFGSNGYYSIVTGTISSFKLVVIPQALKPNPTDGSVVYTTDPELQWQPGIYADKHDVYVGTDFDDVNDATRASHPGMTYYSEAQDANNFSANGLTPGVTYYWRIDGVRSDGYTIDKGHIWSFMIQPLKAYGPSPADEAQYVDVDEDIYWEAGSDADKHDVYLDTDYADVNNATRASHPGLLYFSIDQDANSYTLGTLDRGTTYYWRIDEVSTGGSPIYKGNVWSFETWPIINIEDSNLLGYWTFDEGTRTTALDWSGHEHHGTLVNGPHWTEEGQVEGAVRFDGYNDYVDLPIGDTISTLNSCTVVTWVKFPGIGNSQQRIFDFGQDVNDYMRLSACNGAPGAPMVFGITTTGSGGESQLTGPVLTPEWHHVAVAIDGDREEMTLFVDGVEVANEYTEVLPSALGTTTNNWLGRSQFEADAYFVGLLDDFRIYNYAMTQEDLKTIITSKKAWLPDPPDNATGVDRYPVLSWQPGKYAASANGHKLYYGTDYDDVNDRIGAPIVLSDPCYVIPGPNAPYGSEQDVYWVVDEVNNAHADQIWPGDVWQFTIKDYSSIDDFDDYTDTGKSSSPPEGTLKSVWVDGNYAFVFNPPQVPGTSGSLVQLNTDPCDGTFTEDYEHYQPGDFAQSGAQSMKFYYDNDGYVSWLVDLYNGSPPDIYSYVPVPDAYLSEAYAAIDDAAQTDPDLDSLDLMRDWSGYKVLQLSFFGDPNNDNDAEPMYVGLEDGDGTLVAIQHPDPHVKVQQWQDWYIKLSDFTDKDTDLDTENIAKIYIGFGIKDDQQPGGTGLVFFDDIQLSPGICLPGSVAGDFDANCVINNADLEIFTYSFPGETPVLPTPIINLSAAGLSTGPLSSWSNSSGSGGGVFTDANTNDPNKPVVETIASKKCVTFDATDMLVWDQNAPATLTSDTNAPNDFTVIYEVYNPEITAEEWLLTWAQRGGPAGTTAGFGYGSDAAWAAVVHWNEGDQLPDMGFDRGVPVAGQWHIIAVTYDGTTEALVTDGAIHNLEDKNLAVYADQPVTIGAPFEVPADSNDAYIRGGFVPTYGDYPYTGSVASIKVYGEAIPPGDLAILTAGLAGLSNAEADVKPDSKIDFGDLAVMGNNWMQDPYLFGEDY